MIKCLVIQIISLPLYPKTITMSPNLQKFLAETKLKCEAQAKKMNALELSIHDDPQHQAELKQYFGFTEKTLAQRKIELQK